METTSEKAEAQEHHIEDECRGGGDIACRWKVYLR